MMDNNIESMINSEISRLKEEEKLLKNALLLKTKKYFYNQIDNNNNIEVLNHNNVDIDTLKLTSKTNNEQKSNGLKYFNDLDENMHNCHLCHHTDNNGVNINGTLVNNSNEFLNTYLKAKQSLSARKKISPIVQDLNKQQTFNYDFKKYIKPNYNVKFKDQNSNSIVSEYRKDIIRPQTAVGRPRTAGESELYANIMRNSSNFNNNNNNNIRPKTTKKINETPLIRSSSTLFFHQVNDNNANKLNDENNKLQKNSKPWRYSSNTATLYPWRDRKLNKN